ncbi:MAG: phage tail sheath family protein [Thermoanaerobaculia bacterium]
MPVTVSYPGVYIEEIPSGVRTITGVATSIAAFVGRTPRGPEDEAVTVFGLGDFERNFGPVTYGYPLGYAVRDFFLNGGGQAIIVRLFNSPFADEAARQSSEDVAKAVAAATNGADGAAAAAAARTEAEKSKNTPQYGAADAVAKAAEAAAAGGGDLAAVKKAAADAVKGAAPVNKARIEIGAVTLEAASPGKWGANLRAAIDGVAADLFNLTVRDDSPGGSTEKFLNLSTKKDSPRRVDRVLKSESSLVRWVGDLEANPAPAVTAGSDAVSLAEQDVAVKKKALHDKQLAGGDPAAEVTALNTSMQAFATAKTNASSALTDGQPLKLKNFTPPGGDADKKGFYALEKADLFNLLCIPPETREGSTETTVYQAALSYCQKRRAMLIVDPLAEWKKPSDITKNNNQALTDLGLSGIEARNAALYFPRVLEADPQQDGRIVEFVPCGAVAGVMARTDVTRGVWKAPAGLDASLNGIQGLTVSLTDQENGTLNPLGVNCLRSFPVTGRVVWGARTLRGADVLADEYKYIPVRRLALFIEESLYRGTQWVVFEPNDEPLWSQIRTNVGAFMNNLFRQGAFQGRSPREAYLVKCDKETTTQNDINLGIVNIVVGFAPLKPAEFVIIKIQQLAGQIET